MSQPQTAFNALVDLAQRSRSAAKGLPSEAKVQPHWSGIGFTLLGQYFVAPMGEVTELLEHPPYTKLPGVQPWVMGVANVRGRLLPLINLPAFMGGRLEGQRKRHRVLVLEQGDLYTGLVVDAALGMQHFPIDTYNEGVAELDKALQPYMAGSYANSRSAITSDDQRWYVFSPAKLIDDPQFINAAQ
ncbi:chemotaxis protein CheW [Aurantivibrio plasticivorans]